MTASDSPVSTYVLNTSKSGHAKKILQPGGVYQLDGDDCKRIVLDALKVGYRCIDTAQFYQNEASVGKAVRESEIPREEIFITTKVQAGAHTVEGCKKKMEKSLNELDIGYIDLFLIHGPLMGPERRISSWKFITDFARETGKVRSCGVSNFGVNHLQQLEDAGLPAPAVNQIELHPHLQQTAIVEYCRSKDILVQTYCPLMRGQNNEASLGEGAAWAGLPGMGWENATLKAVSEKYDKSIPQILLRWAVQKGYAPQAKTSSLNRLKENFDIFAFNLAPEDMRKLDEMNLEQEVKWEGKRIALEWNPVDCV